MVSLADWSDQVSPLRPVLQAVLLALLGCSLSPLVTTCVEACPSVPPDRSTYELTTTSRGLLVRGTPTPTGLTPPRPTSCAHLAVRWLISREAESGPQQRVRGGACAVRNKLNGVP